MFVKYTRPGGGVYHINLALVTHADFVAPAGGMPQRIAIVYFAGGGAAPLQLHFPSDAEARQFEASLAGYPAARPGHPQAAGPS